MDQTLKNSAPNCSIVLDAIRAKESVLLKNDVMGDVKLELKIPEFEGGLIVEADLATSEKKKMAVILVPFANEMYAGKKKNWTAQAELEKVAGRLHNKAV